MRPFELYWRWRGQFHWTGRCEHCGSFSSWMDDGDEYEVVMTRECPDCGRRSDCGNGEPADHCWLVAGGREWRVARVAGLGHVEVRSPWGEERATLDLSGVRWDEYCEKAVRMLELEFGEKFS